MHACHLCDGTLADHHQDCRTHRDLDLFTRVYWRLVAEKRNPALQKNLARQLIRNGRGQDLEQVA